MRHLLTHQSGIRHYKTRPEGWSSEHYSSITDSLKIFKDEPLLFELGAQYRYTTYGYSAALVLIPERGVAIAVMTNLSDAALQNVVNGVRKALIGGN